MSIVIEIEGIGPTEFPDEDSALAFMASRKPEYAKSIASFLSGMGEGVTPGMKYIRGGVQKAMQKITGKKTPTQEIEEGHEDAKNYGSILPDIVRSIAAYTAVGGGANSILQRAIPKAGSGVMGTLLNAARGAAIGAPSNVVASQFGSPAKSADELKSQAVLGAVFGSVPALAKPMQKGASGVLASLLKRPNAQRAAEIAKGGETVEDFAARQGPFFATSLEGLGNRAMKVIDKIEKRLAPIYEANKGKPVDSNTVLKELNKLKSSQYMDARGNVRPNMENESKVLDKVIDYVKKNYGGKPATVEEARGLKRTAYEAGKKAWQSDELKAAKSEAAYSEGKGWRKGIIEAVKDPSFESQTMNESKFIELKKAAEKAAQTTQKAYLWRLAVPASAAAGLYGGGDAAKGGGTFGQIAGGAGKGAAAGAMLGLMAHPAGRMLLANALMAGGKGAESLKYLAPTISQFKTDKKEDK